MVEDKILLFPKNVRFCNAVQNCRGRLVLKPSAEIQSLFIRGSQIANLNLHVRPPLNLTAAMYLSHARFRIYSLPSP